MRADRLLTILLYLQTEGRLTAKELAQRLEVSERTIYRDMDALGTAGVPVYATSGADGGFSLPPDYRTKLDGLTRPEIHALFLHESNQTLEQLGIGDSLRSALLKLRSTHPTLIRQDANWINNRILLDTDTWRPSDENIRFLPEAQQAIWEEKRVVLRYAARSRETSTVTLEPYGLVAKAGIWFIVGAVAQHMRAYRLARIQSLQVTAEHFSRSDTFSLQRFWQEWVARWAAERARYAVVVDVTEHGLTLFSQINRLHTGKELTVTPSADRSGWMRLSLCFESEEAAIGCMFALGTQAVVIEPAELTERLREQAAQLADFYARIAPSAKK